MADSTLNRFHASGTTVERGAFTPTPPTPGSGPDHGYTWWDTDDQTLYSWDAGLADWVSTAAGIGVTIANGIMDGRLTTESGVPFSTSDRTAQSTIYWTPYNGNRMSLYTGSSWTVVSFTQLSLALSGLTSGKPYDVFLDYNAGTPQLVLSAAWTNDTTRADAVTTQDGVVVKSGATDHRLIGTIYTTSTTTTEDSAAKRFVWNVYNQLSKEAKNATETTNTWAYTTATFRQANASATNQFEYVTGNVNTLVQADVIGLADNTAGVIIAVGVGIDSTSSNSAQRFGQTAFGATIQAQIVASYKGYPGLGKHTVVWLEWSTASGTTNWYGDMGSTSIQTGIQGTLLC